MSLRTRYSGITLLSLLGIADAWYLAEHAITDTALSCGVDGALSGCNVVAQSQYSHFFGVPLGIYGIAFYGLVLLLALVAWKYRAPRLPQLLAVIATVGMLASSYFLALQLFVIEALCIYCIGSFVISVAIFLLTLTFWRRPTSTPPATAPPLPSTS